MWDLGTGVTLHVLVSIDTYIFIKGRQLYGFSRSAVKLFVA